MRRGFVLGMITGLLLLGGCATNQGMRAAPASRLIYSGGSGNTVYSICDRGNRIYLTERGPFQVVPGGCMDGQP